VAAIIHDGGLVGDRAIANGLVPRLESARPRDLETGIGDFSLPSASAASASAMYPHASLPAESYSLRRYGVNHPPTPANGERSPLAAVKGRAVGEG
jgi:hypothetical protein